MILQKRILNNNTLSLEGPIGEPPENLKIEFDLSSNIIYIPEIAEFDGEYRLISRLGHNCFDNVPAEKIVIPKTIKEIEWSFYECSQLRSILVADNNFHFCDIDGVLYSKDKKALLAYPNAKSEVYHIPNGTEIIRHFAFKTCKIKELHIPSSITKIEANAFYCCRQLKDIFFEDKNITSLRDMKYAGFISTDYGSKGVNPVCHFEGKQMLLNELANFCGTSSWKK